MAIHLAEAALCMSATTLQLAISGGDSRRMCSHRRTEVYDRLASPSKSLCSKVHLYEANQAWTCLSSSTATTMSNHHWQWRAYAGMPMFCHDMQVVGSQHGCHCVQPRLGQHWFVGPDLNRGCSLHLNLELVLASMVIIVSCLNEADTCCFIMTSGGSIRS